ncbi:MAG TPA: alpha/beta fold hydrolase, partial [Caldilineaceae bacterium]|nr:alpha/beta fold hydrolase [Caldilineaceae bacterium]
MKLVQQLARAGLVLALWLPAACAPVAPATVLASPFYPVELIPAECPLRVPDELEEGSSLRCGRLRVPQDRRAPAGLQVELPYALVQAESAHPRPEPLVYIVGGPGGSALAEFEQVYGWLRTLRRERDLILYDQRGTLLADPALDCSDSSDHGATEVSAQEMREAQALVPPAYQPLDANDLAIHRCAKRLAAAGVNLAAYDTPTHAQDLLDLVAALGYRRFDLYATSYGTRIALEVMRLAGEPASRRPDAPALRAAVLDSVLPPSVNAYEQQAAPARAEVLAHALELCAQDPACAAAYPDLAARLERLLTRLDAAPLALPLAWQPIFGRADLLYYLTYRLDAESLAYLPRLVAELEQGETATLTGLLNGALPPRPPRPPRAVSTVDERAVQSFIMALNGAYYLNLGRLDETAREAARAEWQRLAARNPDRERLARFIQAFLPPAEAGPLLEALAALGDDELAAVFADLAGAPVHPLVNGANLAVECRDELPFNDYGRAVAAHRSLELPAAVVTAELEQLRRLWAQCALFPTGAAAITQTLPVTSDIPVLIFQGGLDSTTPPSWAALARRSLSRAHYLEFPAAAHVVIRQPASLASDCPARLARQ